MKKEKYIIEVKRKKATTFRVVIPYKGKSKSFGTFSSKDYITVKEALHAAKVCRDSVLNDIEQNRYIEHDMTVDEAYEETKRLLIPNVNTQKRHDDTYYPMMTEELRMKPIKDVTAADIQKCVNDYAAKHTQNQVKKAMTIWRQIYQVCFLNEMPIIDRSRMIHKPISKVPPKTNKKHCTPEELEGFIKALLDYDDSKFIEDVVYVIRIMQYLGLRPQEALAVCKEDIDLDNNLYYVRHSIGSDSEGMRKLITTKNPGSIRVLPIPNALRPYLVNLLNSRFTEPLLLDQDRKPYFTQKVDDLMSHVSKKCKIKVTLYMMRHNFATEMVKKDLKATQNMMGHKTPVMTMKYVKDTTLETMSELLNSSEDEETHTFSHTFS